MNILNITTGFIEIPNLNTMNIHTVGCSLNCPGCHNPELQNYNHPEAYEINIQYLSDKFKETATLIDGICWMGGEPMDQLQDLIRINKVISEEAIIVVYTGYTMEQILEGPMEEALRYIDIIKTGPWKGIPVTEEGSNQCFYIKEDKGFLKKTYEELKSLPW